MNRIWMVVSTVALANILAIAGLVGWLKMTDRLDTERLGKIRSMLSVTISAEKARLVAEEAAATEDAKQKAEAEKMAKPPQNAGQQITAQTQQRDIQQQDLLRLQQELRLLRDELANRERTLATQRTEVEEGFKRLEAAKTEWERTLADKQFRTALETLEAQKPKDTKATLQAMIDADGGGAATGGTAAAAKGSTPLGGRKQVVTYLTAMDEEMRSKVMAEFIKTDPRLAAELLEQLRTRGIDASAQSAQK